MGFVKWTGPWDLLEDRAMGFVKGTGPWDFFKGTEPWTAAAMLIK